MADPPRKRRPRIPRVGDHGKRHIGTQQGDVYRKATSSELIRLFNQAQIEKRVASKDCSFQIVKNDHPSSPLANEPVCTRSQLLEFYDKNGQKIAVAHRYLRPDNTVGLSGRPDPKEVLHEGVRYYSDLA